MCGIFGAVDTRGCFGSRDYDLFVKLTNLVEYRGPDSYGHRVLVALESRIPSPERFDIFLGHRRLSILDLSEDGRQPMSDDQGTWIVYNGEIFNYLELRGELESEGVAFRTKTDTEVILHVYKRYGPAGFNRFNGMWAFAIVDLPRRRLILSRDRFSMKPLYVFREGTRFFWASEIKQLLPLLAKRDINENVMSAFLAQALVEHTQDTFIHRIAKLPPKSYWVISLTDGFVKEGQYWDFVPPSSLTPDNVVEEFKELFLDSVRLRLRSDVKVGCLLSGGIDSSAIAAACKPILNGRLETYSVVSDDAEFSEEQHIDKMIAYLGCANRKLLFRSEAVLTELDRVLHHNDEPIAGFSVVAQFEMLKMIKRKTDVVVLLSGQGADEILLGYLKFFFLNIKNLISTGKLAAAAYQLAMSAVYGTAVRQFRLSEARRYIPWLDRGGISGAIRHAVPATAIWKIEDVRSRQIADIDLYSVPALARYEDRNSMAHSLEVRHPFLDHRLVNFLVNLPSMFKLNKGWTKYLLRQSMTELPESIRWRRDKKGFSVPEESWLRGELVGAVRQCFGNSVLAEIGTLDVQKFLDHYDAFLGGRRVFFGDISRVYIAEIWARKILGERAKYDEAAIATLHG